MGIYISDVMMPVGEGSCLILKILPNGEVYDKYGIRVGIESWSEAMDVPPESWWGGRLIGADVLDDMVKYISKNQYEAGWNNAVAEAKKKIRAAETIIPIERGFGD